MNRSGDVPRLEHRHRRVAAARTASTRISAMSRKRAERQQQRGVVGQRRHHAPRGRSRCRAESPPRRTSVSAPALSCVDGRRWRAPLGERRRRPPRRQRARRGQRRQAQAPAARGVARSRGRRGAHGSPQPTRTAHRVRHGGRPAAPARPAGRGAPRAAGSGPCSRRARCESIGKEKRRVIGTYTDSAVDQRRTMAPRARSPARRRRCRGRRRCPRAAMSRPHREGVALGLGVEAAHARRRSRPGPCGTSPTSTSRISRLTPARTALSRARHRHRGAAPGDDHPGPVLAVGQVLAGAAPAAAPPAATSGSRRTRCGKARIHSAADGNSGPGSSTNRTNGRARRVGVEEAELQLDGRLLRGVAGVADRHLRRVAVRSSMNTAVGET